MDRTAGDDAGRLLGTHENPPNGNPGRYPRRAAHLHLPGHRKLSPFDRQLHAGAPVRRRSDVGRYGRIRTLPPAAHRPRNRTHGRSGYAARSEFGEGIALLDGKIYQLTWENNKAYVYDAATGRQLRTFAYAGEGWGLTTDGERLYMSDGSEYLRILDPETFRVQRSVPVTFRGAPVQLLNELEWIDGKIWANVYVTDQIVIIDPASGIVEGVIDLRGLLPDEEIAPDTDVLNGIAYDAASERIFVTGKRWSKLFEIEIIPQ